MSDRRPEDVVVAALTKALIDRGCEVCKVHGNLFQSGLPDLLVTREGLPAPSDLQRQCWAECKVLHQLKPRLDQLFACLRPAQRRVLCTWAHRHGVECYVVAQTSVGLAIVPGACLPQPLGEPLTTPMSVFVRPANVVADVLAGREALAL